MPDSGLESASAIIVVAGANGSGKSTLTARLRARLEALGPILDPDAEARTLDPTSPERAAVRAGRAILERSRALLEAGQSFTVETTLSSRGSLEQMRDAKARGYGVHLLYVGLGNPDLHVLRVLERTQRGGHAVPEADVRRRYARSLANLPVAARLADSVVVFDNAGREFRLVLHLEGGQVLHRDPSAPGAATWWERTLSDILG